MTPTSRWTRAAFLTATLLVTAALTHLLHLRSAQSLGAVFQQNERTLVTHYLPNGKWLRPFTFGQRTTVADLYFLKFVQYLGTPAAEHFDWPQLYQMADLITDLDPEYGYAYEVSGILLSVKKRIDESTAILEKGIENVPSRWQLPFFASYNYWYEKNELEKGAQLLFRAARLPKSPPYLASLASRIYSTTGRIDAALGFIDSVLDRNPPESVRIDFSRRRVELLVERDLQRLESALQLFEHRLGRPAQNLRELVGTVISYLPAAPDGSPYNYNAVTGELASSMFPQRLKFYRADKAPDVVPQEIPE